MKTSTDCRYPANASVANNAGSMSLQSQAAQMTQNPGAQHEEPNLSSPGIPSQAGRVTAAREHDGNSNAGSSRMTPSEGVFTNVLNWLPEYGRPVGYAVGDAIPQSPSLSIPISDTRESVASPLPSIQGFADEQLLLPTNRRQCLPSTRSIDNGRGTETGLITIDLPSPNLQAPAGSDRASSPYSPGTGHYYVDGDDGGRLPHTKKRKLPDQRPVHQNSLDVATLTRSDNGVPLGFWRSDGFDENLKYPVKDVLPEMTYRAMARAFIDLCCSPSICFQPFESQFFPSHDIFNLAVLHYFEEYTSLVPFYHHPSSVLTEDKWVLALAMAAIGMHSMPSDENYRCSVAAHEFARRALLVLVSTPLYSLEVYAKF